MRKAFFLLGLTSAFFIVPPVAHAQNYRDPQADQAPSVKTDSFTTRQENINVVTPDIMKEEVKVYFKILDLSTKKLKGYHVNGLRSQNHANVDLCAEVKNITNVYRHLNSLIQNKKLLSYLGDGAAEMYAQVTGYHTMVDEEVSRIVKEMKLSGVSIPRWNNQFDQYMKSRQDLRKTAVRIH